MTVVFYNLQDEGAEYEEVAAIEDGEFVHGKENVPPIRPGEADDPEALMERFDGPYLVAAEEDEIERSYWITEPRRGIVGKYDGESYEYEGAHDAAETMLEMGDLSGLEATPVSLVPHTRDESNLLKQSEDAWIPYQGPQGGEGWQQVGSGEVRYQQEPPGEVAEGYEEDHWRQNWPELEDSEWDEDVPDAIDMEDGDLVLFVNRNGESEVGEVAGFGFVRREGWDQAKTGVELRDGREVTMDEIAAHADMSVAVEPPTLDGGAEWSDTPDVWWDYTDGNLVYYQTEDGEERIGMVEGGVKDRQSVKIQDKSGFHVVDPDRISHYAKVDSEYNAGYEIVDSPFDGIPPADRTGDTPSPEIAEEYGADVDDVKGAFGSTLGRRLMDELEDRLEEPEYDADDPNDTVRAIVGMLGDDDYSAFKQELRGRANGVGTERAKRIIDEAFALDVADPRYSISDTMSDEERRNPEDWLRAAAKYAQENENWVSLQKLQESMDDWSGTVGFSMKGAHDFEDRPDEIVPLSETGANAGISAEAMFLAEWEDGGKAYVTRVRDTEEHGPFHSRYMEESGDAERAMTGYNVQGSLNEENDSIQYPDHEYRYDEFFSVEAAPDDARLVDGFLDEEVLRDIELPDGHPDNDIADRVGADVEDVKEAISGDGPDQWQEDVEFVIDQDPNLDPENPSDWVAASKTMWISERTDFWNNFVENLSQSAYESPVDRSDYKDMAAAAIISGNRDLHSHNVMVDDDGTLYPIDLDRSGYSMDTHRFLSETVSKLTRTAESLGIEAGEEFENRGDPDAYDAEDRPLGKEILEYVEEFANEIDSDELRSANPMYMVAGDEVRENYEAAKQGDLTL